MGVMNGSLLILLKCNVPMRKSENEMAGLNRLPLILTCKTATDMTEIPYNIDFSIISEDTCAIAM